MEVVRQADLLKIDLPPIDVEIKVEIDSESEPDSSKHRSKFFQKVGDNDLIDSHQKNQKSVDQITNVETSGYVKLENVNGNGSETKNNSGTELSKCFKTKKKCQERAQSLSIRQSGRKRTQINYAELNDFSDDDLEPSAKKANAPNSSSNYFELLDSVKSESTVSPLMSTELCSSLSSSCPLTQDAKTQFTKLKTSSLKMHLNKKMNLQNKKNQTKEDDSLSADFSHAEKSTNDLELNTAEDNSTSMSHVQSNCESSSTNIPLSESNNLKISCRSWSNSRTVCQFCNTDIRGEENRLLHCLVCKQTVNDFSDFSLYTNDKVACPICKNASYFELKALKVHMVTSHYKLVQVYCIICKEIIGDFEEFWRHVSSKHAVSDLGRNDKLSCPLCEQKFKLDILRTHISSSHSDIYIATCKLCGRVVRNMLRYFDHFQTYHVQTGNITWTLNDIKSTPIPESSNLLKINHVCNLCPKTLDNVPAIMIHSLTHKLMTTMENVACTIPNSNPIMVCQASEDKRSVSSLFLQVTSDCKNAEHSFLDNGNKNTDSDSSDVGFNKDTSFSETAAVKNHSTSTLSCSEPPNSLIKYSKANSFTAETRDPGKQYKTDLALQSGGKMKNLEIGSTSKLSSTSMHQSFQIIIKEFTEAVNKSYSFIQELANDLHSVLISISHSGSNDDVLTQDKVDMDKVLSLSSAINKVGSCVMLVLEECANWMPKNYDVFDTMHRVFEMFDGKVMEIGDDQNDALADQFKEIEKSCIDGGNEWTLFTMESEDRSRKRIEWNIIKNYLAEIDEGKNQLPCSGSKEESSKQMYVCKICSAKKKRKIQFRDHVLTHLNIKPFVCQVCHATFLRRYDLQMHMAKHAKQGTWKCELCHFIGKTEHELTNHMDQHPIGRQYKCARCDLTFCADILLKLHIKDCELKLKHRKCLKCPYKAVDSKDLMQHKQKEHSYLTCKECGSVFKKLYQLYRHRKRVHATSISFVCEICGADFKTRKLYNYHMVRHVNAKPLECDLCDYRCSSMSSLKKHKLKHAGLKPYKCDVCGFTCNATNQLKVHKLKHDKEYGFKCEHCGKKIKWKQNYKEHLMIHMGQQRYNCGLCGFGCQRKRVFDQHMEMHENNTEGKD